MKVPMALVKKIAVKGIPLMVNETLWAAGVAFVNRCYSTEGLEVVAANNIVQTFFNVFSVAFMAVGVAIGKKRKQKIHQSDLLHSLFLSA